MKGIARIQLFDAATGALVSEHVEENMVTKAAESLLTLPLRKEFAGGFYSTSLVNSSYLNRMLPMATELFGGVLLFRDQIEATETTFFPPKDSVPVGHAGAAYSGASPFKGTHNDSESGVITDTSGNPVGYKHVWDFATDKANGTVGCICLTSVGGGEVGWNGYVDNTQRPFNVFTLAYNAGAGTYNVGLNVSKVFRENVPVASPNGGSSFNVVYIQLPTSESRVVYMKESTGEVWYISQPASMTRESIFKATFPRKIDVKLNTTILDQRANAGLPGIALVPLYAGDSYMTVSSTYFYEGNIHSITALSDTSITHRIFDLEGTLTSNKVVPVSQTLYTYGGNASAPLFYFDGFYYASLLGEGNTFAGIGKFDETGALVSQFSLPPNWPATGYRVSISSALKCPIVVSNTYNSTQRGNPGFIIYGDRLVPIFVQCFNSASYPYGLVPFPIEGLDGDVGEGCSFAPANDNSPRTLHMCMYPAYLATINNLASPVTKTSAMTMKLVYELYDA